MISFKANYISSPTIQRINISGVSNKKVSFIEVLPSNSSDKMALNLTAIKWDKKGGKGFAYDICNAINRFNDSDFKKQDDRFFVITTQKNNFEELEPKQILAMSHIKKLDNNTQFLEYLQVDPKNSKLSNKAGFKHIGAAMLNSLKQIFANKDIALNSVKHAVKFYIKNGFEYVKNVEYGEKRMLWKHSVKTLH